MPRGFFYFILFYIVLRAGNSGKTEKKNKRRRGGSSRRRRLRDAPRPIRAVAREESVRWRQNARFMTLCEEDGEVCVQSRA